MPTGGLLALLLAGVSVQTQYVERSSGLELPGMEAGPTEIEFGDVNADGHPDIVSVGDHGNPLVNSPQNGLLVWFGDGSGVWTHFQTNSNFGYGGCALGDANGDGRMDVAYAVHHNYSGNDFGNQLIELAVGDGSGRVWTPWDDGLATNGEDYGMFGTDLADFDNDGDLDIGSISFGCCSGVHAYRNNGNGAWTQTYGFLGGNSTLHCLFADFNGDGNADIAAGQGQNSGTLYWGDGKGGFRFSDAGLPSAGNLGRAGLSAGDLDGDGRDDLGCVTASGAPRVYRWVSEGVWADLTLNLQVGGAFYLTQLEDLDNEGRAELLALRLGAINAWKRADDGTWTPFAAISTPASCDYAAFRAGFDFDHNGFSDMVSISEENCRFGGGANRVRAFLETTPALLVNVHPKRPRTGEAWRAGSVRFVDWNGALPTGRTDRVTIEVSLNGSAGPWKPVANSVPNNGRFQWRIPNWPGAKRHASLHRRRPAVPGQPVHHPGRRGPDGVT